MKWLAIVAVLILAQQPTKPPNDKGATKSDSAKSATHTEAARYNEQPSQTAPPVAIQTPVAAESQRSTAAVNGHTQTGSQQALDEARSAQRELTWFTGVLASVGVLQLIVMFLTWLIYRRQAHEMRRQRHEMRRQRYVMLRQWRAMRAQLGQMESSGKQTDKIIEQSTKQVTAAEHQTELMKTAGTHTEELAQQAVRQTELTQAQLELEHRPWISVDVTAASPIVFNEQGCSLLCNFTMTNVGHSVAKHVSLWTDFAILGIDNPIEVRDRLCDIMKQPQNENSDYGWLLFPNQRTVEQRGVIAVPERIQKALEAKIFQGLPTAIGFHLVGCVDYPSPLDSKKRHQTRFIYNVSYVDTAKGRLMGAFDQTIKEHNNITFLPTLHGASAD